MPSDATTPAAPKARFALGWTLLTIALTLFVLMPVLWLAAMAFKPDDVMFARPTQWAFTPTLDHFVYVIDSGFVRYLLTSVALGIVSTVLVVLIGTPAAYASVRAWRRRSAW